MIVPSKKRHEYWNHFVARLFEDGLAHNQGVTGRKLARIKPEIMNDNGFWLDVVSRHNGLDRTPEEMQEESPETYTHAQGNFWGMVMQAK